eukprot:477111_1
MLLNAVKNNSKLLSEMLLSPEPTIIEKKVSNRIKEELELVFKFCNKDILTEEMFIKLLKLCGWGVAFLELRDVIFAMAESIGINKNALYSYVDILTGNIPLYSSLVSSNKKMFEKILGEIDLDDKKEIEFLISYKNYDNKNLLHAAGDLKLTKQILGYVQFQKDRENLLLHTDNTGNNALMIYLTKVNTWSASTKKDEHKEFIEFYFKSIKKDQSKFDLLNSPNTSHFTVMTELIKKNGGITDGLNLVKNILKNIKFVDEESIPFWAKLLEVTLTNIKTGKDLMEMVQMIVNKYDYNKKLQQKLLFYSDEYI